MSLKVWLPLIKNTKNYGTDKIIFDVYRAAQDSSGKIGSCYSFSNYANLKYTNFNMDQSKWTISAWIYMSAIPTGTSYVISLSGGNGSVANHALALVIQADTGAIRATTNSNFAVNEINTNGWALNTWTHAAATFDGTTVKLYINGKFVNEASNTPTATQKTNLVIGARSNASDGSTTSYSFTGKLNDVRIYDECLGTARIEEIAQGLILHYKLDKLINDRITDSSGYGNHGEIVGELEISNDTPRYQSSIFFNSAPYIRKTNFIFTINTWTISCWEKKTSSVTNAYETICGLTRDNGADANKKFSLYIYNNKVGFVGEATSHSNLATLDNSLWHHICLTNSAGTYKYYIDGVLNSTYTNSNNLTNCTDFVVGGRAAVEDAASIGTPWGGNISDIRMYCTALDADAIRQLYEVSAKVDNKQNLHTFELVENDNTILITKKGHLKCSELEEEDGTTKFFKTDKTIHTQQIVEN